MRIQYSHLLSYPSDQDNPPTGSSSWNIHRPAIQSGVYRVEDLVKILALASSGICTMLYTKFTPNNRFIPSVMKDLFNLFPGIWCCAHTNHCCWYPAIMAQHMSVSLDHSNLKSKVKLPVISLIARNLPWVLMVHSGLVVSKFGI